MRRDGEPDPGIVAANPAKEAIAIETPERLIETPTTPSVGPDAVELALAAAIQKAAAEGRFDVLPPLVTELEARRKARQEPEVVDLETQRAKRR